MTVYGFTNRADAETLKQVAMERRTRPDVASRIEQEGYPFAAMFELVSFQISGAHALNTVLDCTEGVWDPATHDDAYTGPTAKCIDRRRNVPIAPNNATGIGFRRASDAHGSIIYILDLDCGVAT